MNIPCAPSRIGLTVSPHAEGCYEIGHRDARHAAAELASEADAIREELVAALEMVNAHYSASLDYQPAYVRAARAALARARLQK